MADPAIAEQPEDAWLTTKVKMTLLTDDTVETLDINVDTFDGWVTLHAEVDLRLSNVIVAFFWKGLGSRAAANGSR